MEKKRHICKRISRVLGQESKPRKERGYTWRGREWGGKVDNDCGKMEVGQWSSLILDCEPPKLQAKINLA